MERGSHMAHSNGVHGCHHGFLGLGVVLDIFVGVFIW